MSRWRYALLAALLGAACARADEGMWTFDHFPAALVKQKYGVEITPAWLAHVQAATLRLANCTGSFVSAGGLILTNHHCVAPCLVEHSSRARNLLERGFLAHSREEELRCGEQVADVLVSVEDITGKVAAATQGLADQAANEARKKALTQLEQACETQSRAPGSAQPLKCESVDLYEGGEYFLYKYRRYTDVRLVFAPEEDIAAFGGDPDNFQFPRWALDMAFLRAYEGAQPAATPEHFTIDFAGPKAGQLVFVAGDPGCTGRLLTMAQLQTLRDVELPQWLLRASELRGRYIQFAKTGADAARIVQHPLSSLESAIKVRRKLLDALLDEKLLARKREAEDALRAQVKASPRLAAQVSNAWAQIARAQQTARELALPYTFIEQGAGFNSRLFRYARTLVRGAAERMKPNDERLREFTATELPRIAQELAANVPVYPQLERLTLSFSLERMREWLGPDDSLVRKALDDESPDLVAARLISQSELADPAVRTRLWQGGAPEVDASRDPMIQLAKRVDPEARAIRGEYESEVQAPVRAASQRIARARFALVGARTYPDATFTLRLNFGTVRGWTESGHKIEPFTQLGGLYQRATGREPFRVPRRWWDSKPELDPITRLDLATDNDIVGGSSGSPLLDARGRLVGLMFDGNIHSISGAFRFDAARDRAIAVDPTIMRAALGTVYGAQVLLQELTTPDERSTPGEAPTPGETLTSGE